VRTPENTAENRNTGNRCGIRHDADILYLADL
jgi:hypothetical protein